MNKDTLLSIGFVLSLLGLALLSYVLLGAPCARLPDPIAIQWGLNGRPTNAIPLVAFRVLALGLVGLYSGWQLRNFMKQALAADEDQTPGKLKLPATCIALCSFFFVIIWSNIDAPRWESAGLWWPGLIGALTLALGLAKFAGRYQSPDPATPKVSLGLAPGEKVAWIQQVYAPKLLWLSVPLIALSLLGPSSPGPAKYMVAVLIGIVLISLAWVRVQVSNSGLRVYYGFWPMPFTQLSLNEISSASVENLDQPMRFGGWGYRGSLRLFKEATIFLRSGPALCVKLTRGRVLRITVDDPETAAGLLNDLCAQRDA